MVVDIRIDLSDIEDLKNRLNQAPTWLQLEIESALQMGCDMIKIEAQSLSMERYKTGFMRSTIYAKLQIFRGVHETVWSIVVGAWAFYTKFQEYGTRFIRGAHFLSNAIRNKWPMINGLIDRAITLVLERI